MIRVQLDHVQKLNDRFLMLAFFEVSVTTLHVSLDFALGRACRCRHGHRNEENSDGGASELRMRYEAPKHDCCLRLE